jgi:hypothetical protein
MSSIITKSGDIARVNSLAGLVLLSIMDGTLPGVNAGIDLTVPEAEALIANLYKAIAEAMALDQS